MEVSPKARNKHGLSRFIPAKTKRAVRTACGFGCVICGAGVVDYEHVDPPFSEAYVHDAENIALLCPACHAKVTRGFTSKQAVRAAMLNPRCKQIGYSSDWIGFGPTSPYVQFAGLCVHDCTYPVVVHGIPVFQIKPALQANLPFRVSASFWNSRGEYSLGITDNEWRAIDSNWDVEVSGGSLTIRDGDRKVSLKLTADPPSGIVVERLDMLVRGYRLVGDANSLIIYDRNGRSNTFTNCVATGCQIGLSIGSEPVIACANDTEWD